MNTTMKLSGRKLRRQLSMFGSFAFFSLLTMCPLGALKADEGNRRVRDIKEGWTLNANGATYQAFIGVSWEDFLGVDFDGKATYQASIPASETSSNRWRLLEIDGAATHAKVTVGSQFLGEHLGGWTPFRFAIPDHAIAGKPSENRLEIELDELVGHNTQGFLPIVVPHFGGIWKHVRIIETSGPLYFDDLQLRLSGFDGTEQLTLDAPIRGVEELSIGDYEWGWRITGPSDSVKTPWVWESLKPEPAQPLESKGIERFEIEQFNGANQPPVISRVKAQINPPQVFKWSPESPFLYEFELALREKSTSQMVDRLARKAAIRSFRAEGKTLVVNGKPFVVRGLLNWGYAPPRLAPSISREEMIRELNLAKELGFNLMKFCLWIPPREYLELADEMGILTWIEYPTWHPIINDQTAPELSKEFDEFFHYDRNFASVLLRSLTCETGHSASEEVIRHLYDLAHHRIPGAIVEDDSSWIQWHRVHDFYDDHPYGNNHTWPAKLKELDSYVDSREAKPLVLGEAIAADTWESLSLDDEASNRISEAHEMRSLDAQGAYLQQIIATHGPNTMEFLRADSLQYAWAMRKYQIEAFRYFLPHGGYVVSVIRDFPLASMGLIDRKGVSKWDDSSFRWHRDHQLVLNQGLPLRAIHAGKTWEVPITVCSPPGTQGEFLIQGEWSNVDTGAVIEHLVATSKSDSDGKATSLLRISVPNSSQPWRGRLSIRSTSDGVVAENAWIVWVIPEVVDSATRKWVIHQSISNEMLSVLGVRSDETQSLDAVRNLAEYTGLILATRWDDDLLTEIQRGASCIMLPDGGPGSFATREHWFLRGGPIIADGLPLGTIPRLLLRDLQAFDLAGPVLFDFPWMDKGTPYLSLWDNHDLTSYRTHSLLWGTSIGRGKLLVCTLGMGDRESPLGPFMLQRLTEVIETLPELPSLSLEDRRALRSEILREQISLADSPWSFRRSRANQADEDLESWVSEDRSSEGWGPIEITRHWDGQGHGDLDGWGYYRTEVSLPSKFLNRPLYLCFTGVDDHYVAYVDGKEIGSAGDPEKRETAFEMRTSHAIPTNLTDDGKISVGVKVLDWQGTGGIFRPVYLATEPLSINDSLLVPKPLQQ